MKKALCFLFLLLLLSACATSRYNNLYKSQNTIENLLPKEFVVQKYSTEKFNLYGLLRPAKQESSSLRVYIEGDGLAWLNRNTISDNPTPTDKTTATLAKMDTSDSALLYLARPCQYVEITEAKMCEKKYWSSHRLSPEVIESLNTAITMAKEKTKAEKISLIGFSGGGGAAVLIAAMRDDVEFIGTLAGLLDHKAWTKQHKISPLHGSLNPLDKIELVKNIKQLHITSSDDKIISPYSQKNYCKKLNQIDACKEISGMEHNGNWWKVWNY